MFCNFITHYLSREYQPLLYQAIPKPDLNTAQRAELFASWHAVLNLEDVTDMCRKLGQGPDGNMSPENSTRWQTGWQRWRQRLHSEMSLPHTLSKSPEKWTWEDRQARCCLKFRCGASSGEYMKVLQLGGLKGSRST